MSAAFPWLAAAAVTAVISIGAPHPVHAAATIVVDAVTDEDLQNASCSLREAIVAANTNASYNGHQHRHEQQHLGILRVLGRTQPASCERGLPDGATVDVALVIRAVNNALRGCD